LRWKGTTVPNKQKVTKGDKKAKNLRCTQLLNWSWDLKLQESYTSLSLLLTTLKRLSSGQHTAPTNHQDKKNLPDQNPDSVLFLAMVFGDNSGVANNDTSLSAFLLQELFVKIYVHQLPW
jgi:hypothetical protein